MTDLPLLADYLDKPELAREFKVTPRTADRWSARPDDPLPYIQVGRRRLYHRPTVRDWLRRREPQLNTVPRNKKRPVVSGRSRLEDLMAEITPFPSKTQSSVAPGISGVELLDEITWRFKRHLALPPLAAEISALCTLTLTTLGR